MILAWFIAKWRWLAICAALITLAWLHGCQTGKSAERAAQAAAALKQAERAREADIKARQAWDGVRSGIEATNDRARDAAAKSDDPLADGLRELRK